MSFDRAVLFVGPTLSPEQATDLMDVDVRGPACRGDVYQAALEEPRAILLVDGAFEDVGAVFHKEILWALAQGIHLFGSSSLGALRAAELDVFGMVGIGSIYEAYRDGKLERDDAVAVLHGPGELRWPLLTRALVDLDATFLEARSHGIIDADGCTILRRAAQDVFWRERTYERIFERAKALGWHGAERERLVRWIGHNEVSLKQRDALSLIEHVAKNWDALDTPFEPCFRFENTAAWQALVLEIEWRRFGISRHEFEEIVERLRRSGDYERVELEAILLSLADQACISPLEHFELAEAARLFRHERRLHEPDDVVSWLNTNRFSHSDYYALVRDHDKLRRIRAVDSQRLLLATLRVLRARGLLQG